MKTLLHPKFRINGKDFTSPDILREYAHNLIQTGIGEEIAIGNFISEWLNDKDFIRVKTSGSTGIPKEIVLHKKQVFNSALATVKYFNLKEGTKALLCLPSEYIAGKMMLVRAMTAGWDLYTTSPEKNPLESNNEEFDFTAMVPYQVFHSLADLHKVKKMIVGGGAVSWELEEKLQELNTQVFATYGMTETISHIAVRPLNGVERSPIFAGLPEISFSQTEKGCLQIVAPTILDEPVSTNDVVELLSPISFKFMGRIDNVINSGGVKVHPEMVEEKLSPYIKLSFFIASEENDALGEQVVLIVESEQRLQFEDFPNIFEALSPYEKPKKIQTLPQFSYTDTGKIKRAEVLKELSGF